MPIPHSEEDEELNTFFKQTDWDVLLSFLTPRCFCCLLFFFILFCSAAQVSECCVCVLILIRHKSVSVSVCVHMVAVA